MAPKVPTTKLLANRINELRINRKWSYTDMALACGIDRAKAHKICTVGLDLRVSTLEKLASGFNLNLYELMNI